MKAQYKSMKATRLSDCGGVGGHIKSAGAKKHLTNSKYINIPVSSAVAKALKNNNKPKNKATEYFDWDD